MINNFLHYKHLIILLILSLASVTPPAFSQNITQTIRGVIVDSESRIPLIGASVSLIDESKLIGTITDPEGRFRLENISIGRHDMRISYLGYEDLYLTEVLVTSGKEVVLTIELAESVTKLNEIVVQGNTTKSGEPTNTLATVSAKSFSTEQSARFAASINDPARLALSFAGVKGQDDIVNGISVRGNSPKGVLWRIEGVEVPDPNHFSEQGYGAGAVSMLSSNVLSTSDFYTGAFPAEYGNAMSAIFDLKLRKGNNEKREYAFQAGILGLEAAMEGPFTSKKKASYLVNYRYSTLSVLEKIGYNVGNSITSYQDINFKLNFPTRRSGTFSIFGVGGLSEIKVEAVENKRDQNKKEYDMGFMGVSHSYSINEKNHIKTVLAFSTSRERSSSSYLNGRELVFKYITSGSNLYGRSFIQLNSKFTARSSLRSGVIINSLHYGISDKWGNAAKKSEYNVNGNTYLLEAYTQWKYRFSEVLSFNSGLHITYFGLNNNYSIEPRGGLKWQINPRQSFNVGVGVHSRLESLAYYMISNPTTGEQPNRNLDFTKAAHLVLGYDVYLMKYLRFKAETYLQYLYDVPIKDRPNSRFSVLNFINRYPTDQLVNEGNGMNYGVELTLEKLFSRNYYILTNGSLYNSKYRAGDGEWYNTRFNANFITSITAGKDFKFGQEKHNILGLNFRVLWSGGERTSQSDYEEKIANYFRLDTRVSFSRNKPKYTWQFSVDVQNTTNRFNENQLEGIDPTGLLPVASFRVSF